MSPVAQYHLMREFKVPSSADCIWKNLSQTFVSEENEGIMGQLVFLFFLIL